MSSWTRKISSKTQKPYYFDCATNKSFFTKDTLPSLWGFFWDDDKALVYINLTTMETTSVEPPPETDSPSSSKKRKVDCSSASTSSSASTAYGIPSESMGTATQQDTSKHHTATEVDYIKRFTKLPDPVLLGPDEFKKAGITEQNMWGNMDIQITEVSEGQEGGRATRRASLNVR